MRLLSPAIAGSAGERRNPWLKSSITPSKITNQAKKTPTKDSCGTDPGHGVLDAQQWYSDVLFLQGVATFMLVFPFPASNQDFRNGHSGLTSIYLTEDAVSKLEITSLIHQKINIGVGFFLSFSSYWAFLTYLNSHSSGAMGTSWWERAFFCITWFFFLSFCFLTLWCVLLCFFLPHQFCSLLTCIPWIFALVPLWLSPHPTEWGGEWVAVSGAVLPIRVKPWQVWS